MEHAFNTNVAKKYDVEIAILLNNFKHWTIVNLANKRNIHDGLCWTFNTIPAFCKIFDYWTRHQIEYLLSKCKKLGLIVSGNYNSHRYDRTQWYALTAKAYQLFPELCQEDYFDTLSQSISEKTEINASLPTISENSEKLLGKTREAALENPRPIPDINTDINTDTPIVPTGDEKSFSEFWNIYPAKKGKKKCEQQWRRLNLDSKATLIIEKVKQQIAGDAQWKRGFIPNPSTYLSGSLWEDELSIEPKKSKPEQKKYY